MKNHSTKYLLIFFIFLLLSLKCDIPPMDTRSRLHVENRASYGILSLLGLEMYGGPIYPDTSLPLMYPYGDTLYPIMPGEQRRIFDLSGSWEEIYRNLPADRFSVYIFHPDTLKKYSWEEVRREYKVLKRYDFSRDELEKINQIIMFP